MSFQSCTWTRTWARQIVQCSFGYANCPLNPVFRSTAPQTPIFAVLLVVVVADLTKGTGRFNLAQGAIDTTIGIGAALSNLAIGFLVTISGVSIGFFTLSIVAAVGMIWL